MDYTTFTATHTCHLPPIHLTCKKNMLLDPEPRAKIVDFVNSRIMPKPLNSLPCRHSLEDSSCWWCRRWAWRLFISRSITSTGRSWSISKLTPLHLTIFGWWSCVIIISSPHTLLATACSRTVDDILKTFPTTDSLADVSSMTEPCVPLPKKRTQHQHHHALPCNIACHIHCSKQGNADTMHCHATLLATYIAPNREMQRTTLLA